MAEATDPGFKTWTFAMKDGQKQKIGEGGFGEVYRARTDRHQTVAVKVVRVVNGRSDKALQKAVQQEKAGCDILRNIKHQNVIRFLKCETSADGKTFYIFTELITGDSLWELMNQEQKPFNESQIRHFTLQICTALNFLHSRRPAVLHRDINCSNIMLTHDGVIKLIDFGIAKEIVSVQTTDHSVKYFTVHDAGTVYFMAPELFDEDGKLVYSAKSDVWALGCTVFQMATMKPPLGHVRQELVALKITQQDMPQLPAGVSDSLSEFYRRCVTKSSAERADTAELLQHRFVKPEAAGDSDGAPNHDFSHWDFVLNDVGRKDCLGKGSFRKVYKALTDKQQLVAVKVFEKLNFFEPDIEERKKLFERAESSCKILKRIRHPSIIQFIKVETTPDDRLVIITELIAGHSLRELMDKQRKPFDKAAVKSFSLQICSALNFLHSRKPAVLHRNVKCSHVMLTSEGKIKLIGFTLSAECTSDAEGNDLLVDKDLCGTEHFMAPELFSADGRTVYTPKTDVWAFGCTVFEMATMTPPLGHINQKLYLALKITQQDMPQLPAGVSDSLSEFYRRCVTKSLAERADTAELLQHPFLRNG